jgi:hypothetical protein
MSEENPIRGKVAKIVTTSILAINRGSDHGVKKNMVFYVLDPATEDIVDPDTGESLGPIKRTKVRVWVSEVEPKVCLAEARQSSSSGLAGIARLFEPEASQPTMPPKTNYLEEVRVGDPVEHIPSPSPKARQNADD